MTDPIPQRESPLGDPDQREPELQKQHARESVGTISVEHRRWKRRFWALVGGLLAFRLVYLAVVPLELAPDEAYYWDWSRRPDWSYCSKPPMVAWLIGASTAFGGSTPYMVRLPAVLLGTLGLIPVWWLGKRLGGPQVGFWSAVIAAANPGNVALSLLMTIDAPLMFCWCFSLWSLWRLFEIPKASLQSPQTTPPHATTPRRWPWLVLAIVTTGLGLLSKQTMLAILPLTGLFLLSSSTDRRELFKPWFWFWVCGSLLFLIPVVIWNALNSWVTLQHTQDHFEAAGATFSLADLLRRLAVGGEFLVGQLGAASPVTWGLLVMVLAGCLAAARGLTRQERFLVCFSGPPLIGVVLLSFLQRVQPNWPAPFYVSGLILLAAWGCGIMAQRPWLARQRHRFSHAVACGLVTCVVTYAVPWLIPYFDLGGSKIDPLFRLRGWKDLSQQMAQTLSTLPDAEETIVVSSDTRTSVGELAFYLPGQPSVYHWSRDVLRSQYAFWGGPEDGGRRNALVITRANQLPEDLVASSTRAVYLREVSISLGPYRTSHYKLWRVVGLRGWPDWQKVRPQGQEPRETPVMVTAETEQTRRHR